MIAFAKNAKAIPLRRAPGRIFAKKRENASCKGGGKIKVTTLEAIPQPPFFFQFFFNQPRSANVTK